MYNFNIYLLKVTGLCCLNTTRQIEYTIHHCILDLFTKKFENVFLKWSINKIIENRNTFGYFNQILDSDLVMLIWCLKFMLCGGLVIRHTKSKTLFVFIYNKITFFDLCVNVVKSQGYFKFKNWYKMFGDKS